MFRDRQDAAVRLAERLAHLRGHHPLVLAIPRGAVPMAAAIARALDGTLDVVLVRKIGLPGHEEFAIGAIDESGRVFLPEDPARFGVDPSVFEGLARREADVLRRRRAAYSGIHASVDPRDRIVVVVDDGAATGASMVAALDSVRARGAARVIAAVPVASPEAAQRIRARADEALILVEPQDFQAVGSWYLDFSQVTDDEVTAILAR